MANRIVWVRWDGKIGYYLRGTARTFNFRKIVRVWPVTIVKGENPYPHVIRKCERSEVVQVKDLKGARNPLRKYEKARIPIHYTDPPM